MRFARHHGPDDGSRKKRAAIRGGNFNNGANCSLASLNLGSAPSNVNTNISFRGIPFADGMRDHGCGKTSDQQYIIRNTRRSMQRNTKPAPGR
jgi:alpha/beta superfamily hydrolase